MYVNFMLGGSVEAQFNTFCEGFLKVCGGRVLVSCTCCRLYGQDVVFDSFLFLVNASCNSVCASLLLIFFVKVVFHLEINFNLHLLPSSHLLTGHKTPSYLLFFPVPPPSPHLVYIM